jgi:plastocyanin
MSRTTGFAILAIAATLALAGCGGDDEDSGGSPGPEDTEVLIADFRYEPETITVEAGQPISFINTDEAPHTATAEDDESFDTGRLELDDAGEVRVGEPGTYAYYCEFHPFMEGTLEVE